MTRRSDLIERVLASMDARFLSIGFKRRRADQDWRGHLASGHAACLHLNFGKDTDPMLATVSVGLAHPALEVALEEAGYRPQGTARSLTFGRTLGTFESRTTGREAPADEIATRAWELWTQLGLPFLRSAADLPSMARALQGTDPHTWPCPSRSHRARLLPLTLWELDEHAEALASLTWLAEEMEDSDQIRPAFADFARWLRNRATSAV